MSEMVVFAVDVEGNLSVSGSEPMKCLNNEVFPAPVVVPRQNLVRRTNPRIFGRMMLSYAYTQDGCWLVDEVLTRDSPDRTVTAWVYKSMK